MKPNRLVVGVNISVWVCVCMRVYVPTQSTYKQNPSLIQEDQAFLCMFPCVHNSKEDFAAHKAACPTPTLEEAGP